MFFVPQILMNFRISPSSIPI